VVLKAGPPHRKDRTEGVGAKDQAEVPAGARAKAEVLDKAEVSGLR